jgi:hypothetical protein
LRARDPDHPALARDGVGEAHGHALPAQPRVQLPELRCERREAAVALAIRGAAREDALQRALRFDRDVRHERERGRHHAVQDDGARVLREAARVMLRDARAVGTAEQVQPFIAERRAHGFEVLHGDARRVEPGPARQLRQAVAREPGERRRRYLATLEGVFRHVAVEAVGAAGAALVHQHEVALATDAGEGAEKRRVALYGSLARAAGDQHERVGLRGRRDCRHDGHCEPDFPAARIRRIFRHDEPAAARLGGDEPVEVGDTTGLEPDRWLRMQRLRAHYRATHAGGDQQNAQSASPFVESYITS